ncbi:hypothetical protein HDA39_006357 [Kribbella italica]|uniref:Uncharacterized protein n=1 Tax=Kribbella italica TaxID=1540520 RepID=A0A7W9JDW1_9ACTN|nr:hypothetical protein [Kribbella italica]
MEQPGRSQRLGHGLRAALAGSRHPGTHLRWDGAA